MWFYDVSDLNGTCDGGRILDQVPSQNKFYDGMKNNIVSKV